VVESLAQAHIGGNEMATIQKHQ